MSRIVPAVLAAKPEDYARLGMKPGTPEVWEDGLRTDGRKGSFEWWYFDSKLADGSSLVIVFHTGPMTTKRTDGFAPSIKIEMTRADGTQYNRDIDYPDTESSFCKEKCDATIGGNHFRGDLKDYEIYFKNEDLEIKVKLNGNAPAWRPHTGHIFFGKTDYFAWLPSVPEGTVDVAITENGATRLLTGTGYHDHNWGNAPMMNLMHHWYWGRAKIGPYQVISSYIYGAKKYGYEEFPIFMLAKDGKVLADQPEKYLTYSQKDPFYDETIRKTVYKTLVYDYDDGQQHYRITYEREGDLTKHYMISEMPLPVKLGAKLMKLDPSYARLTGSATLERLEGNTVVESFSDPAIWELMYFGTDRP